MRWLWPNKEGIEMYRIRNLPFFVIEFECYKSKSQGSVDFFDFQIKNSYLWNQNINILSNILIKPVNLVIEITNINANQKGFVCFSVLTLEL